MKCLIYYAAFICNTASTMK